MWEVLLTACLLSDPSACRTDRLPGGASYAECRVEADRLARLPGPAQAQDWPCVPEGGTPDFPVTEIAPGVWVHKGAQAEPDAANRGDVANLGFVVGEDAVAAIDAGSTPEIAGRMLAAIRERTVLPVRWLILTHMHPDHALGASAFREAGATIVGHARLPAALGARAGGYAQAMARLMGVDPARLAAALPDETVSDAREIDLGGRTLRLTAHPTAHTDNDLTVEDAASGVRFLGDLLFVGHTPALDGSIRGWIARAAALAATPGRVAPGHGPVAVDLPEAADPMRRYLDRIAEETRAAIGAGQPMLSAVAEIGEAERPRWLLFDAFNQRNATAAFQELEWE